MRIIDTIVIQGIVYAAVKEYRTDKRTWYYYTGSNEGTKRLLVKNKYLLRLLNSREDLWR